MLYNKINKQKGFTITPAMLILVLLMIAGITFLTYINSTGRAEKKIENSQTAKYVAEIGINQLKSQLAKLNESNSSGKIINKWFNAKKPNGDYIFISSASDENSRSAANTSRVSNYIDLRQDLNNSLSKIIGKYRITVEDGSKLASGLSSTGSSIEGKDKYGNDIWSNTTNMNIFPEQSVIRLGVKVSGDAVDSSGNIIKNSTQSIYAVLDIPQSSGNKSITTWTYGSPSDYMLSTDGYEAGNIAKNDRRLTLLSNQIITGPIHTNNRLDFIWYGNFDIKNSSKSENSAINANYTIGGTRFGTPNTFDPPSPLVEGVYHDPASANDKIIIYGLNFSKTSSYNTVVIPGLIPANPNLALPVSAKVAPPPYNNNCMKLEVTLPSPKTYTDIVDRDIFVKTNESAAYGYTYFHIKNIVNKPQSTDPNIEPPSVKNPAMKIYGVMQVSKLGTLSEKVYKGGGDYNLLFANDTDTPEQDNLPYLDWSPNTPPNGSEPGAFEDYIVTYITDKNIPHKKIKVYDKLTYSGDNSKLYYVHSHKAPGTTYFPWTGNHTHSGNIFGMNNVNLLEAKAPDDYNVSSIGYYDWMTNHRHEITPDLLTGSFNSKDDLFFFWDKTYYKPSHVTAKVSPLLSPNNVNFYTQREYANQVLKISQGKSLSRDSNNKLEPIDNKFTDDRKNGFYDATLTGGIVDFRAVYFGNDLKYTAGPTMGSDVLSSGESSPKLIYVNEKKYLDPILRTINSEYLKVSSTALNSDYKLYRYIEIPHNGLSLSNDEKQVLESGVIFVKEGYIYIGGGTYKGNASGYDYVYGKYPSNINGSNTIIDGRLAIISYSEKKPSDYNNNNPGDIMITGNIIYKNKIFPYKEQFIEKDFNFDQYIGTKPTDFKPGFRQYPYNLVEPTNMTDTGSSKWITHENGKPVESLTPPDKVNSLGLFAFNDIKIPVNHYYQPSSKEDHYTTSAEESSSDCPCKDELEIHAQLIAGHKITQTKIDDDIRSKNDRLIMYGSFYSTLPPNLSYFDGGDPNKPEEESSGRLYLFDRTLSNMPLVGAPTFPNNTSYTSNNQIVVGTDLPRVVPGTWKLVTDGS